MNLQNLVDYCQEMGLPDPFSGASVPAPLNLDTVKSAIMVRCGLLTPVYGEPEVFTSMTTHWFFTKQWTFEHLIKIIQSEYSPIENVSELRNEKTKYGHVNTKTGGYKDTEAGKDTDTHSGKDTVTNSGKDVSENSGKDVTAYTGTDNRDISNTGTDTTTNTVSAYNTSGYQADNQSALLHGHTVDDDITYGKTETVTNGLKNELTHGLKTETDHGHKLETEYGHNVERVYNSEKDTESGTDELIVSRHGNIGVTTNQQMINEELDLLRHFDIYSYIAELFENDNMLMIY